MSDDSGSAYPRRLVGGLAHIVHNPVSTSNGETVLLLHGIGGNADTFTPLLPQLAAAGWQAIAWDAPGYGQSADPQQQTLYADSPSAYADAVVSLLNNLDVTAAHIVGVSWGGVIATYVASQHPDLVISLTLVDSTRGSGTTTGKAAAMRDRVASLREQGAETFANIRAPRLLSSNSDPHASEQVRSQMAAVRVAGYSGAAEMMAQSDTSDLLPDLNAPTLVVVGDEDRVTGIEESRLLAERIPSACLEFIEHAGHAAVQEQPTVVANKLLTFLDRTASR